MSDVVVNELLCYVRNNFGMYAKDLVGVAVVGFYSDQEVSTAKLLLREFVDSLNEKPDGFPRTKNRMDKDNRRKLEVDDILSWFTALDVAKVVLPTYVAADLQRLPTVSPGEVDVYGLAAAVKKLSTQVDSLSKQVAEQAIVPGIGDLTTRVEALELQSKAFPPITAATSSDGPQQKQLCVPSWSTSDQPGTSSSMSQGYVDLFSNKDEEAKWFAQTTKKHDKKPVRRIVGGNTSGDLKVKAVAGSNEWHIFAGRLDPETSADDVT